MGKGVPSNQSAAAHYFKLSADQGNPSAQFNYGVCLQNGQGVSTNQSAAAHYFKLATDQGDERASLAFITSALSGVALQADLTAMDRTHSGLSLLSGVHGRFDFSEAQRTLAGIAGPAGILCAALDASDETLVLDRASLSAFSLLRSGGLLAVRVMIPRLRPRWLDDRRVLAIWRETASAAVAFLARFPAWPKVQSLASALPACESVLEIVRILLTMHFLDCSVFTGVNAVLRKLPMRSLAHFVDKFCGLLSYTVLLQAAIEVYASERKISDEWVVYRGLRNRELAAIYASAIGEVVVWPAFTAASRDLARITNEYASGDEGILFEIALGPGNVAAEIGGFSNRAAVSEVIIAAESAFRIDKVEECCMGEGELLMVRMTYVGTWSDGDIECNVRPLIRPAETGLTHPGIGEN
jgi:hypothetical protein